MNTIRRFSFLPILFLYLIALSPSSASSISDAVFESHNFNGRSLLQAKKACPINFEFLDYSNLTSQCKGPTYPAKQCCAAFKEFACPYADEISDLSTDCASTMFSYINLNGRYPPGLFANECKEGKEGLDCSNISSNQSENANGASSIHGSSSSSLVVVAFGLLVLLF